MSNSAGQNVESAGASVESSDNPEVAWWCKLLTRVVASVGGVVAFILGIFSMLTFSPLCIVASVMQMLVALLLLLFEAPICCQFFNYAKPLSDFADRRSFMQKALIYVGLSIPPVGLCFSFTRLIGCGLIFATGVLYGLMSLGKKADRQTMLARAAVNDDKIILVPDSK
jgi:hypothetical protein